MSRETPRHPKWQDKIYLINFLVIKAGKLRQIRIPSEEITREQSISLEGHVTGILVFCEKDVDVSVEDLPMNPVTRQIDGTYLIRHFGSVKPEILLGLSEPAGYFEGAKVGHQPDFLGEIDGYCLFSRIMGDAINLDDDLSLTFSYKGQTLTKKIIQKGYRQFSLKIFSENFLKGAKVRYLGRPPACSDAEERISAILSGIARIEEKFGLDLIGQVSIIDYEGIRNAVTTDDDPEIWIYGEVFRRKSLEELESIAEHETLHRLVSKMGLAKDRKLKKLYCNLCGFSENSYEHYLVMEKETYPQKEGYNSYRNSLLFSIINERNYLDRGGGHSRSNSAEFCTSFLHTLMYPEFLPKKLQSVRMTDGKLRRLTRKNKKLILQLYGEILEMFINILPEDENDKASGVASCRKIFENSLSEIARLSQKI